MKTKDNKRTNNVNSKASTSNAKTNQAQNENKHKPLVGIIRGFRFNENGEPEVLLALRVNEETIDVNGQRSKIRYVKIGALPYPCILEWVPAEECMGYIRLEWAEVKVKDRSRRCPLPNGKGGFIRCPERKGTSCCTCDRAGRADSRTNLTISLDALLENKNYELKASFLSDFTVAETMELLEMLIVELDKKSPEYGKIFLALFRGITKPRDIAQELGLPKESLYKDVPKVRKLAQEIYQRLTTI